MFLKVRVNLTIENSELITHWFTTLYEYLLKKWLIESMQKKHCWVWINKILHFNKLTMLTAESEHWRIKQRLESSLKDLLTVVKSIHIKFNDQLHKIHLHYKNQKSETMLTMHSVSIFQYLHFEVSIDITEHMFLQWEQLIKKLTCLSHCIRVFWIIMSLLCKHELQKFLYVKKSLKQDHLHSHWWLNSLAEVQSVNSVTIVQNSI